MIPVVSFVGMANSGKTTLLEKVVRELKLKNCRVAVIKHSHHDFEMDLPGKDSWRLAQAGSDLVALTSPHRMAVIERYDVEPPLHEITALFEGKADIVLTEGYKNGDCAKILVRGVGSDEEQLHLAHDPLLTITAHHSADGAPEFDGNDIGEIVGLLMRMKEDALCVA